MKAKFVISLSECGFRTDFLDFRGVSSEVWLQPRVIPSRYEFSCNGGYFGAVEDSGISNRPFTV